MMEWFFFSVYWLSGFLSILGVLIFVAICAAVINYKKSYEKEKMEEKMSNMTQQPYFHLEESDIL